MNINNFHSFKHKILSAHNLIETKPDAVIDSDVEIENEFEIFYLDEEELEPKLNENTKSNTKLQRDEINLDNNQLNVKKKPKIISTNSHNRTKSTKDHRIENENYRVSVQVNECLICSAVLSDILQLNEHTSSHLVLKCKICKRDFMRYSNLKRHFSEKHTKPKPFLCNVCGLGFSFSINLQTHLAVHRK